MASSVAEFLSGLPSQDPDNFQKWTNDGNKQNVTKRPTSYLPTKDIPSKQVIVTEKTNILLRYLHQQFEKKKVVPPKRESLNSSLAEEAIQRKRPRFD